MKKILIGALLTGAAVLLGAPAHAQEKKAAIPDEKALMEAMIKAGTPGEQHKKLNALAGSWEYTAKCWMDPSKSPSEFKGTAEQTWVMGGRFLEQKVKGDMGGMEFVGHGLIGYDNLQKKYTTMWVDSMSTSIMTSLGTVDQDGKTFTFTGEEICPLTHETLKCRNVTKIISNDKHEAEFYRTMGGQEIKAMQITFTRKK